MTLRQHGSAKDALDNLDSVDRDCFEIFHTKFTVAKGLTGAITRPFP